MSIEVMSWVWKHSVQQEGALLTLLALADWADDNGFCWPSIPMLAKKARLSERQVFRVIRQLKYDGELLVEQGGKGRGNRSRYTVVMGRADLMSPKDRVTSTSVKGDICDSSRVTFETLSDPVSYYMNRHKEPSKKHHTVKPYPIPEFMTLTEERRGRLTAAGCPNPVHVFADFKTYYMARRHVRLTDWDLELDRWASNHKFVDNRPKSHQTMDMVKRWMKEQTGE